VNRASSRLLLGCRRFLLERIFKRFGVRAMGETHGVETDHPRVDIVAAEKRAPVVKNNLVKIVIVMEERHLERARIGFERSGYERADYETVGHESGMGRRWQVIPMAHHGPDIAPVHPHRAQVAFPANCIQRIVRKGDAAQAGPGLYPDRPFGLFLLVQESLSMAGIQHRGIKIALGPRALSGSM
jgi:hypothetical protein